MSINELELMELFQETLCSVPKTPAENLGNKQSFFVEPSEEWVSDGTSLSDLTTDNQSLLTRLAETMDGTHDHALANAVRRTERFLKIADIEQEPGQKDNPTLLDFIYPVV